LPRPLPVPLPVTLLDGRTARGDTPRVTGFAAAPRAACTAALGGGARGRRGYAAPFPTALVCRSSGCGVGGRALPANRCPAPSCTPWWAIVPAASGPSLSWNSIWWLPPPASRRTGAAGPSRSSNWHVALRRSPRPRRRGNASRPLRRSGRSTLPRAFGWPVAEERYRLDALVRVERQCLRTVAACWPPVGCDVARPLAAALILITTMLPNRQNHHIPQLTNRHPYSHRPHQPAIRSHHPSQTPQPAPIHPRSKDQEVGTHLHPAAAG
jgi:hypothetical protein